MIIDLTMPIDEKTPVFPGSLKQEIKQIATLEKDGWNEKELTFKSHFSTHIDAPLHMLEKGKTLTDFPLEKFLGEAVVIDTRGKKEIEADLTGVKEGDIVFFLTGHSKRAYKADYFKDNPVITEKNARQLINRRISIVGLDSFTVDNEPFAVHKMFLKEDILIVENLINLEKLAGKRFQCYILPLKIQDADGAPCRIIAVTG
ncbi:cyclase family protein [Candidatus Woesearchaeota archaeon]|nr:cyclase family protein [Candidatus Woesearchaeota archaeon]